MFHQHVRPARSVGRRLCWQAGWGWPLCHYCGTCAPVAHARKVRGQAGIPPACSACPARVEPIRLTCLACRRGATGRGPIRRPGRATRQPLPNTTSLRFPLSLPEPHLNPASTSRAQLGWPLARSLARPAGSGIPLQPDLWSLEPHPVQVYSKVICDRISGQQCGPWHDWSVKGFRLGRCQQDPAALQ